VFFPDPRKRVGIPRLTVADAERLKKRAYKPAFVDVEKRPDLSFSFLRPPGWEVSGPTMIPTVDFPVPFLASLRRRAPDAALEVAFFEATFDCLPGDFLDSVFDGLTMTDVGEGPLGDGWYADRSVERTHGYELLAALRLGKDLVIVVGAAKKDGLKKAREEMLHIIGTFALKEPRGHPFVDRYRMHTDDTLKLQFAVPDDVKTTRAPGGVAFTWDIEGGPVEFSVRQLNAQQRRLDDVEKALFAELKRKGIVTAPEGRGGDIAAAAGGVLAGDVVVREYTTTETSKRQARVVLFVGTRTDGTRLRFVVEMPAREAHKIAWMRARFAFVQMMTTLRT
jgi:hypothetical protein